MDKNIDQISRSIGQLEAGVANIGKQVEKNFNLHHENSKKLTDKLDEMTTSVTALISKVEQTDKDIQKIKPQIEKLNSVYSKASGMIAVVTVVVGVAFNFISSWLKSIIT